MPIKLKLRNGLLSRKHNLSRLTQEEIENPKGPTVFEEI